MSYMLRQIFRHNSRRRNIDEYPVSDDGGTQRRIQALIKYIYIYVKTARHWLKEYIKSMDLKLLLKYFN